MRAAFILLIQVIFFMVAMAQWSSTEIEEQEPSMCTYSPFEGPRCLLWSQLISRRDDYTYTPNIGGHKVHNRAATWHEARRICEEEGGYLTIINSIAESMVISDLFNKTDAIVGATGPFTEFAFIGFHDLFQEGEFLTIHGQSLERAGFSRWSQPFQPDNSDENDKPENCGSVHKNGGLNDLGCDKKYGFVCEVP